MTTFASLFQYLPQHLRETMLRAAQADLAAIAEAMAGASDIRAIGVLQGRYAMVREVVAQLMKP